jgi:hypothetical protein
VVDACQGLIAELAVVQSDGRRIVVPVTEAMFDVHAMQFASP